MNEVVLATLDHVEALAPRLRKGDLAEIAASSGMDPEYALLLGMGLSDPAYTWLYKGKPLAMFGVAPDPARPGVGIPWLLAAKGAERHKSYFVRQSRKYMAEMLERYAVLENWVDARNTASIQWLSWVGFALAEVDPFHGVQRLPFIRFIASRRPTDV